GGSRPAAAAVPPVPPPLSPPVAGLPPVPLPDFPPVCAAPPVPLSSPPVPPADDFGLPPAQASASDVKLTRTPILIVSRFTVLVARMSPPFVPRVRRAVILVLATLACTRSNPAYRPERPPEDGGEDTAPAPIADGSVTF